MAKKSILTVLALNFCKRLKKLFNIRFNHFAHKFRGDNVEQRQVRCEI